MAAVARPPSNRILRGSRAAAVFHPQSSPALSDIDSAFQLQEYIAQLIQLDVHDVQKIVALPSGLRSSAADGGKDSEKEKDKEDGLDEERGVDEACWIYEHMRRLTQDLTHPLITLLQTECTRASCPEMKAGEWLYLCVAHGNGVTMEQCCAIDYITHTLDSAVSLLNSPRAFPSRLNIPNSSKRHFQSLARRLSRIFAHAYYHHRDIFEQAEAESSLYARFLHFTQVFALVPPDFVVIPPRQASVPSSEEPQRREGAEVRIGRPRTETMVFSADFVVPEPEPEDIDNDDNPFDDAKEERSRGVEVSDNTASHIPANEQYSTFEHDEQPEVADASTVAQPVPSAPAPEEPAPSAADENAAPAESSPSTAPILISSSESETNFVIEDTDHIDDPSSSSTEKDPAAAITQTSIAENVPLPPETEGQSTDPTSSTATSAEDADADADAVDKPTSATNKEESKDEAAASTEASKAADGNQ